MNSRISRVGVVGLGVMGRGIIQLAACRGFDTVGVVRVGADAVKADQREEMVRAGLERLGKKGGLDVAQVQKRFHMGSSLNALLDCDLVIESIIEDESAKKMLIEELNQVNFDALLVTNTSSISITRLASVYTKPERFMGMHFMNPVTEQPGCELVRGLLTSDETFDRLLVFCRELKKEPILSEDKAGFGINRMVIPFLNEAVRVVEEGVMRVEEADKIPLCMGHRIGPITTIDYIGLDTVLAIDRVMEKELGPFYKPPVLLKRLVEAGCLGVKSGRGFYLWEGDRRVGVNPAVERFFRR